MPIAIPIIVPIIIGVTTLLNRIVLKKPKPKLINNKEARPKRAKVAPVSSKAKII